jgi:FAD:protein FMN transferase
MSPDRFFAMGAEVVVGGASPGELAAIEELFATLEQTFSRFRPESELNRVNAASAEFVAVSPTFARVLALALDSARRTDGLVDPTLGAAIEAAGYDRDLAALATDPGPAGVPIPSRLGTVALFGRVLLLGPGVKLDLNGVVKSAAVDDAVGLLGEPGFVSAGGDLAARGEVEVALPGGGVVRLLSGGLATSGRTRRRWLRGGVEQHHLLDPATGRPSDGPWEEVTACARTCLAADVAAKTAYLLGGDGPDWLDARGLPGRFVSVDAVHENRSWREHIERFEPACS